VILLNIGNVETPCSRLFGSSNIDEVARIPESRAGRTRRWKLVDSGDAP